MWNYNLHNKLAKTIFRFKPNAKRLHFPPSRTKTNTNGAPSLGMNEWRKTTKLLHLPVVALIHSRCQGAEGQECWPADGQNILKFIHILVYVEYTLILKLMTTAGWGLRYPVIWYTVRQKNDVQWEPLPHLLFQLSKLSAWGYEDLCKAFLIQWIQFGCCETCTVHCTQSAVILTTWPVNGCQI
jgi:hypothetical protein